MEDVDGQRSRGGGIFSNATSGGDHKAGQVWA
jgi:hypothetical protein